MTKPSDIISEAQLQKWLGLSDYQLEQARSEIPKYRVTRECRVYNRQWVTEWLEKKSEPASPALKTVEVST